MSPSRKRADSAALCLDRREFVQRGQAVLIVRRICSDKFARRSVWELPASVQELFPHTAPQFRDTNFAIWNIAPKFLEQVLRFPSLPDRQTERNRQGFPVSKGLPSTDNRRVSKRMVANCGVNASNRCPPHHSRPASEMYRTTADQRPSEYRASRVGGSLQEWPRIRSGGGRRRRCHQQQRTASPVCSWTLTSRRDSGERPNSVTISRRTCSDSRYSERSSSFVPFLSCWTTASRSQINAY